ncbi:glycosyltransferase [Amycolatopsis anabasis]|uniref:glycosyltransferase n=1 Tax=Amycolatopsis anabasis TaxID=1840409 RepID=UPI00131C943A|nr:glycosyltransferase [Amycolatopsis anabasis]
MRVLHVISEMGTGGAEALVREMAVRGEDFGWLSGVASGGGRHAEELGGQGIPIFGVPVARRRAGGLLRAAASTRTALRRFQPDAVIAHNVSASASAKMAMLPGRRVPLLTVFHGVAEADYPDAARILHRTSDQVVAVATAIADRLAAAGLTKPAVIRNAVSPVCQPSLRGPARQLLTLSSQDSVALCVARLEPQKRHDVLLEAWARLGGPAVLLIAGDGSLRGALERRCADLGIEERVRFLGNRNDVPALLAAADVTVLTSDWEGLPIAVLESLAAGCPVVATDVDGVRELLADGGGVLVPPRDPDATAEALRGLLADRRARNIAAAMGLTAIRRRHDPNVLMRSYDELLRSELVGGRR